MQLHLVFQLLLGFYCILAQPIAKHAPLFTSIYAFGDSYTDNMSLDQFYKQNLQHIDKNSTLSINPNNVERFSNGPLWIENLASQLDNASLFDFARSGATSNNSLIFRSTQDVNMQITAYNQSDVIQQPKLKALYSLWIGVNDMDVLFQEHPDNSTERQAIFDRVIDSIQHELTRLYDIGARRIVLMGLIPLQELPKYNTASVTSDMRENLKQLVLNYNERLVAIQQSLNRYFTDANVVFFDTFQQFYRLFDSDTIARNAKTHCNEGNNCDGLMWWDPLHPSSSTHKKIGDAVLEMIKQTKW